MNEYNQYDLSKIRSRTMRYFVPAAMLALSAGHTFPPMGPKLDLSKPSTSLELPNTDTVRYAKWLLNHADSRDLEWHEPKRPLDLLRAYVQAKTGELDTELTVPAGFTEALDNYIDFPFTEGYNLKHLNWSARETQSIKASNITEKLSKHTNEPSYMGNLGKLKYSGLKELIDNIIAYDSTHQGE